MGKRPRIHRFKPNDIISADDLNGMLDAIEALEARVAALEGKEVPRKRARNILHVGPRRARAAAAAALAKAEGCALYRVDLSSIVSNHVGETEKQIDAAFAEAEAKGAILLFDEADALFGRRADPEDAHDRHANIELGYLLERLEGFCGIAILGLVDGDGLAFSLPRRFDEVIRFPD